MKYRLGNEEFYAIVLKNNCKIIGNIYFGNRDFGAKEIGYIINKNYQRQGYASEAANAIIDNAFKNNVHRVYAECNPNNTCSRKFLEHLNFEKEVFYNQNVYFKKDNNGNPIWQDTYVCYLK